MQAQTVDQVLKYALSFEGLTEYPLGSNQIIFNDWFYGHRNYGDKAAWCDTFQSYIDAHCGIPLGPGPKGSAYTPSHALWFQNKNLWGKIPRRGAYVFFKFYGPRIHHVGRIISVHPNGILTIEGNTDEAGGRTGGKVMQKFRKFGSTIVGYGYPEYGKIKPPTPQPLIVPGKDLDMVVLKDEAGNTFVWDGSSNSKPVHIPDGKTNAAFVKKFGEEVSVTNAFMANAYTPTDDMAYPPPS